MKLVTTPVEGYTGKVGNVHFADGQALVADDAAELAYFRSAGYLIEDADEAPAAPAASPVTEPSGDEPAALPKKSASTDTWRRFAVDHRGMSEDEASSLSRDELVARFAPAADDEEDQP